jgi:hypothetical protein
LNQGLKKSTKSRGRPINMRQKASTCVCACVCARGRKIGGIGGEGREQTKGGKQLGVGKQVGVPTEPCDCRIFMSGRC